MPDRQPTRSGRLRVNTFDIWWEYFGDGRSPVVCLLNGLAMHTKAWYPFLDRLLPDHDVLLYDYPGQGESSSEDVAVTMPELAGLLRAIADELAIPKLHVLGVSYGGFVALEFARLFQQRLHTMTLSGILLSHEELFEMYEALSLRFYRAGPDAFDLYTAYMYEKIFGEAFVRRVGIEKLEAMRARFRDRYAYRVHSLVRLTEAQDPFFSALDANLPMYRSIATPTLVMPGAEDRVIAVPVQKRICAILPNTRWAPIEGSGHVVYLEKPDVFWPSLRAFIAGSAQPSRS